MLIYKTTKKSLYILKTEAEAKQKQSEAEAKQKAKQSEAEAKQKRSRSETEANQSRSRSESEHCRILFFRDRQRQKTDIFL